MTEGRQVLFLLREIRKSYYEETVSSNGKAQDENLEVVGSSPTQSLLYIFLKGSINHAN